MDVRRQGFRNSLLLHQHKGKAVGEAPIFVGTGAIKMQCFLKKGLRDGAKTVSFLAFEFRKQLQSCGSATDAGEAVRDLKQDAQWSNKRASSFSNSRSSALAPS